MKIIKTVLTFCLLLLIGFASVGFGMVGGIFQGLWEALPEIHATDLKPSVRTRIFDRNSQLLQTLGLTDSRMKLIRIQELPDHVKNAFIAVEDERFRSHFGIDIVRIVGAIIIDIRTGKFAHGASTITQQLIRNVYLSPEKSITRKLKEIILALRMEYLYTKDEILEMYLNTVFFGENFYGIETASREYFNKASQDLTIAEAALLAGLLKAPNKYSPLRNMERARSRQKLVLGKMLEMKFVSIYQYDQAFGQELVLGSGSENVKETMEAPYFTQVVVKDAFRILGRRKVLENGLRIYTTLDLGVHRLAEQSFRQAKLFQSDEAKNDVGLQGAFVVRDVSTGDILSLIGGRDFQKSKFNRAVQARRQPGSCFKPFIYAAAFEKGTPANLILNDEPLSYYIASEKKEWTPENYGGIYHGPCILRTALEHSYNMISIKLLERTGIQPTIEIARKMGIESYLEPNLTLALGSTEVTPVELVSAYSTIANYGVYAAPRFITKIEDANGVVLYRAPTEEREAISVTTAFKVFSMMESVVQNGSGKATRVKGLRIAGKTGTNQDYIDTWFIGMTRRIAALVTFGYNSRKSLENRAPSSRVAAPVIGDFFRTLKMQMPEMLDEEPEANHLPPELLESRICRVSGLLASPSCRYTTKEIFDRDKEPRAICPVHGVSTAYLD
ncbi:PBP1A family penicillin-binding protein [bacterium]|jgi:penicillin-binding protein 1A|nr:PBP1A family penicillin-binding protein [bacterium]